MLTFPSLVDNVHVENQTTDTDTGMVNWTTNQGANIFQAAWTSEFDDSGNIAISFEGQTWLASQPTDKASFTGSQVTSGPGSWFASTTSQGISFVLSCVGCPPLCWLPLSWAYKHIARRVRTRRLP